MNEQTDVLSSSHSHVVTVALPSVNHQTFQLINSQRLLQRSSCRIIKQTAVITLIPRDIGFEHGCQKFSV